jgi:Uma2 family endonuclease
MAERVLHWELNLDDPRAPSQDVWARMTPEQRAEVVDSLPSEFPPNEASPPEGDHHYATYSTARETLSRWFRERGRNVYVSGNLPVYYPGERMCSPDVIAVLDVAPHPRPSWIVSHEGGRGLDLALEVIVSGRRRKDLQDNVSRYARLAISEYFVFDFTRQSLVAYRLAEPGRYERQLPQAGHYRSEVLGLNLSLDAGRLRFSYGDAALPAPGELLDRLSHLANDAEQRAAELAHSLEEEQQRREEEQRRREEEQRRREEEQHRREEEQRRREAAEAEVERLRAELEALRGRTGPSQG